MTIPEHVAFGNPRGMPLGRGVAGAQPLRTASPRSEQDERSGAKPGCAQHTTTAQPTSPEPGKRRSRVPRSPAREGLRSGRSRKNAEPHSHITSARLRGAYDQHPVTMLPPRSAMYRLTALVLISIAALGALETPLVIQSPLNNELTIVINPSVGTMTMYRIQDGKLNQRGSANFLSDISVYEKMIYTEMDGQAVSYLQTGSTNNNPTNGDMILKVLGGIRSSRAEKTAGVSPLSVRAIAAEREFWGKDQPYDGVVRAALSIQYLMLAVPSKRTVMVYDTASEQLNLVAWHNYGPELYVPQVLTSTPLPSEIMKSLPKDVQEDRQKQLQDQLEALTAKAEQAIDTKPSDVWMAAGKQERFVLFDSANHCVMSYEFTSKDLKLLSVRNTEVDMLIPTNWHSTPEIQAAYDNFKQDKGRQAYLTANGITDYIAFQVYVESKQGGTAAAGAGKISPLQANVNQNSGEITLDFTDRRKLVVYRFAGGENQLQLMSFRDYTVDTGIAMLEAEIRSRSAATDLYNNVKKLKNPKLQLLTLQSALKLNPYLYHDLEKDKKIVKDLGTMEGYPAMIEEATKKAAELDQQHDALIKAIDAKRKALAEAKNPKK